MMHAGWTSESPAAPRTRDARPSARHGERVRLAARIDRSTRAARSAARVVARARRRPQRLTASTRGNPKRAWRGREKHAARRDVTKAPATAATSATTAATFGARPLRVHRTRVSVVAASPRASSADPARQIEDGVVPCTASQKHGVFAARASRVARDGGTNLAGGAEVLRQGDHELLGGHILHGAGRGRHGACAAKKGTARVWSRP